MRWRVPIRGDDRIVKRFAFLPITLYGEVRWLEIVYLKQAYSPIAGWIDIDFVSKEDYWRRYH